MSYPDEVLLTLSQQHELPDELKSKLRDVLMIDTVQLLIERARCDPSHLIMIVDPDTIYIPSSKAIQHLNITDFRCLLELKKYLLLYPDETHAYLRILAEIKIIDNLRTSHSREKMEKKLLLQNISEQLERLYKFITDNPILSLEISTISRALTQHLNSELKWLQREAVTYFKALYSYDNKTITDISFLPKVDGVQLGNRMLISYQCDECTTYHTLFFIKTHQLGSLREGASTIVPVDPKELFVYKVLENTGFGPKAHFFFNRLSPSAFFIATQDEGFTDHPAEIRFFKTYGLAREMLDGICDRGEISDEIKYGVALVELILRIFNLWDITMNPGNYGYVSINEEMKKWSVIDFRVDTQANYYQETIFEAYRDGQGMEGYLGLPNFALTQRTADERIKLAFHLMKIFKGEESSVKEPDHKKPLLSAITKAYEEISTYLVEQTEALQLKLVTVMPDLQAYVEAVQANFQLFENKLKLYQAVSLRHEPSHEPSSAINAFTI